MNQNGYETVDNIRELAPSSFRIGGRLVTESDYKTFILSNFSNRIHDVYVCNNTTYITLFYQWLYNYGKLNVDIRKYNYRFCDTCDFNNIYLWMKPLYKGDLIESDKNLIIDECNKIKTATVEIVPCSIIETIFLPYVNHPNYPVNTDTLDLLVRRRTSNSNCCN